MSEMTVEERLDRIERAIVALAYTIARQGTEQDGNWGYKPHTKIFREIICLFPDIDDEMTRETY